MRLLLAVIAGALLLAPVSVPRAQVQPATPALIATDTPVAGEQAVYLESAAVVVERGSGDVSTTIDMVFRNPGSRVLEGDLQFPLAPGQQVSAFALDVAGHMRDAVPVEKARGRQVLEAVERRRVDPGLLEQTQGEFFRLRIYPFAPHGTRTVRITLSQSALRSGSSQTVALPLDFARGLSSMPLTVRSRTAPAVEGTLRALSLQETAPGVHATTLAMADVARAGSLRLVFPTVSTAAVNVQTFGRTRYFVADVPVSMVSRPRALPVHVTLLWDSSQSGAKRAHDLEYALLDTYLHARTVDVELVRFRDVAEPVQRFHVAHGDWHALRAALDATVYDGATTRRGWKPGAAPGDLLLFSDGMFNYGSTAFPTLNASQRLYTIRAGVAGDAARLTALARTRRGDAIALDDTSDLPAARRQLLDDAPRIARIDAAGASDVLAESPIASDGVLHIAGRMTESRPRVTVIVSGAAGSERIDVPFDGAVDGTIAAPAWARFRLAQLLESPDANRAAISRLGSEFHVVTPGSSLIVLEQAADYVRYGIAPPDELAAEYASLVRHAASERATARQKQLDEVRAQWAERIEWWNRPFPKHAPPRAKPGRMQQADAAAASVAADALSPASPPPAAMERVMSSNAAAPQQGAQELARVELTGSRVRRAESGAANDFVAHIDLQPWTPDSPFARRLRTATAGVAYGLYLDERSRAEPGTAFYLDVADVLFDKQRPDLALRVLSNIAEMDLDNRHVLRVLGYRLMQAKHPELAVPVLEQVLAMSDDEPQSYRDLALAYADLGDRQKAVDRLYEIVTGTWDGRFPGIEVTALAELNALVATSPHRLDTHRFASPFLRNLPLALRAVLSWDADNSDMDLWVTDPNGEKAYYGNQLTYQGGRMSEDFTGGYGPEEFALRTAKPGKYRVEANYFGDRQQLVTGATTLSLWLSTGFGTSHQKDQRVTLRLKDQSETVFVGEFDVR